MQLPRFSSVVWTLVCLVGLSSSAQAGRPYKTTYGEDPIPGSRILRGPYPTTYGQDPVPAKSLSQRVWEFRNRPARLSNFRGSQVYETPPGNSTIVPSMPTPPPDDEPQLPSSRKSW